MLLPRRNLLIGAAALPIAGLWSRHPRADVTVQAIHGMAMHGDPKYAADFKHFDYVNPDAPKGGTIKRSLVGSFDSFNGYVLQGDPGPSSSIESLLVSSYDEPFSKYGLIAATIEVPEDRSWIVFTLRPEARWHDGKAITVDDVIFSFNILKTKGAPNYRLYYHNVAKVEQTGDLKVKFTFSGGGNRELPLIVGELPILPKHYWEGRNFEAPTLEPPLGSGPYKVDTFEAGRWIVLKRVPDYWGKDLAVNVGEDNWEFIRYDYYRDPTVALEAFKAGNVDLRIENSSHQWATAYDTPAKRDGRIIMEKIPDETPQGMQGYFFNLRRDIFKNPRVREALAYAFDFEWMNKTLSDGQLVRTRSYWQGSELAATGLPSGAELDLLQKYRGRIPDEVFTTEYQPPKTDGSGNARANLRKAAEILKSAGWEIRNGKLTEAATGKVMEFEILLGDSGSERGTQPMFQNLERLGVTARMRTVDSAQYENRLNDFDFDVIIVFYAQSLSPGNEQREFWGSAAADQKGSRNLVGIKDPVIDELIDLVIAAPDRESLVTRTRALDRVLQWGFYCIPQFNVPFYRVAYWNKFSHPTITPKYSLGLETWWVDPQKEAALRGKQTN
jgi:microcin C transport system substrate-binding protein